MEKRILSISFILQFMELSDSSPEAEKRFVVIQGEFASQCKQKEACLSKMKPLNWRAKRRCKPGPKGPSRELIEAVVQTKPRNPTWGCPRIAQQMAFAFDIPIDKDIVRRILADHYRPKQDSNGPSWLVLP